MLRNRPLVVWAAITIACSAPRPPTPTPTPMPAPASSRTGGGEIAVTIRDHTLGAQALEALAVVPVERAFLGLPHLAHERSAIRSQRATIELELDRGGDLLAARTEVIERLQHLELAPTTSYELGPFARRDGVVLRYVLRSDTFSATMLRDWQDWWLRTRLMRVPGVADVAVCGGAPSQMWLHVDPGRTSALGVTLADIASAVRTATGATDLEALGKLVVAVRSQTPVFVRDVAAVEMGSGKPGCVAFEDGRYALLGTIYATPEADRFAVRRAVADTLQALRVEIPHGLELSIYDADSAIELVVGTPPVDRLDVLASATRELAQLPGVGHAVSEAGSPDGGSPSLVPGEAIVRVYPKPGPKPDEDRGRLATLSRDRLSASGLVSYEASAPRVQILGPDLVALNALASKAARELHDPLLLAADLAPRTNVIVDWTALARYGIPRGDVTDTLAFAAGAPLGYSLIGDRRVPIAIRAVDDPAQLAVRAPDGAAIPLATVARIEREPEPVVILRDDGERWVGLRVRADEVPKLPGALHDLPRGYAWRMAR